jgi:WD40 repeat protein
LRIWNVETGKELLKLKGHADKAAGVFSPDSKQVLTFSPDKTLRLWSVETGAELKKLEGHTEPPIGCFAPDGKQALSCGPDQTIRLWDLKTGQEIQQFGDVLFKVNYAGFVADGRRVVGNNHDERKFRVWETSSGKLVREIDSAPFGENSWSITASPDGRLALVSHIDGSVRVLDLATGKEIHRYDNCPLARGFSFSADGTLAAAGSFRRGVFVFRLPAPPVALNAVPLDPASRR